MYGALVVVRSANQRHVGRWIAERFTTIKKIISFRVVILNADFRANFSRTSNGTAAATYLLSHLLRYSQRLLAILYLRV